jgi:hypothetical protein
VPICGKCKALIASRDINVATDIAYCRNCNIAHRLSVLVRSLNLDGAFDPERPPIGTSYRSSPRGTVIGASHRSLGASIGLLLICLFWNGILSVFVTLALSATLTNFGLPAPSWFPGPKMNGRAMGWGMTIFLWIFLTPFIAIGAAMFGAFVSTIAGRTEIRLRDPEGIIFTGIGALGRKRRFDMADVREVRVLDESWRDSDGDRRQRISVVIETKNGNEIKFGSMLTDERKEFVAGALRKSLGIS